MILILSSIKKEPTIEFQAMIPELGENLERSSARECLQDKLFLLEGHDIDTL